MTFDRNTFLSFIIKTTGEIVAAMPDDEEFSVQQIGDHVAGHPEVMCETCDGFLLFRDRDANIKGLPLNPLATCVYTKYAQPRCPINGRAFLAHPNHLPPHWRRRINTGRSRRSGAV